MLRSQETFSFGIFLVCIQTAKQQLNRDSEEIYMTDFVFADGKQLKIKFQEEVSGWLLNVEPYNKV